MSTHSADIEDDSEAFQIHQQLLAMGFPAHIALGAAKQFPDDIGEAVDWIQNKEAIDAILHQQSGQSELRSEHKDNHPHTGPLHENHQNIDNGYHAEYEDDEFENEPTDSTNTDDQHGDGQRPKDGNTSSKDHDDDQSLESAACSISEALRAAESVIKGIYDPDLSPDSMLMIAEMIGVVHSEAACSEDSQRNEQYPEHVMTPFIRWTESVETVTLNKMYHEEICQSLLMQHDRVRNLYAFDRLNMVFQNVQRMECHHTGWVSLYFLELLLEILERIRSLEYSQLDTICLHDINNMGSLTDSAKYEALFEAKQWKIEKGVSSLTLSRLY